MTDWIIPFLCGLGASILSAWGVGGGTLLLLVMTLFLDVDQRTAQGINLLFFLPTAASALVCHARGGYLDKPTLKSAVPLAVAAALAFVETPPEAYTKNADKLTAILATAVTFDRQQVVADRNLCRNGTDLMGEGKRTAAQG